ncbi:unnamed protein product, partial [Mesorhabditis belari]|uniref:Domain of unknown function DB domain-containing protein n=1 Tax=Mesorhabditis belari TaxID=2138241 RepID=A0AAF3EZP2_9BILA
MLRLVAVLCLLGFTIAGKLTPNEKLKKCCAGLKDVDKECVTNFCDFNAINQANILNFMDQCQTKGGTVGKMWDCASYRHDHTACCEAKGVEGDCLKYCKAEKGVPTNYLEYTFCTESFNAIRDCFYEHLDKNPPFGKGKSRKPHKKQ